MSVNAYLSLYVSPATGDLSKVCPVLPHDGWDGALALLQLWLLHTCLKNRCIFFKFLLYQNIYSQWQSVKQWRSQEVTRDLFVKTSFGWTKIYGSMDWEWLPPVYKGTVHCWLSCFKHVTRGGAVTWHTRRNDATILASLNWHRIPQALTTGTVFLIRKKKHLTWQIHFVNIKKPEWTEYFVSRTTHN